MESDDDVYIVVVDESVGESGIKLYNLDENEEKFSEIENHKTLDDLYKSLLATPLNDRESKDTMQILPETIEMNVDSTEVKQELNEEWQIFVNKYVEAMEARAVAAPPPIPHMVWRIINGLYKCACCQHVSPTEKSAIKHYRFRHGMKYHKCLACNSAYRRHDTMLFHESHCEAETAHLVRMAREVYTARRLQLRKIPYRKRRYFKIPCHMCGKLVTKANMKLHLDVHSDTRNHGCPYCPARYRTKRSLLAHINAHSGSRPYICDQCPKAYTSDTALRAHKQDHGDRAFHCNVCQRAFKRKNSLKLHMTIHSDGNEYLCPECGKVTHNKNALQKHIRIHDNNTKFKCEDCGKSYKRMTTLNFHMKGKHGKQIITRKMFFNKLPTMVDWTSIMMAAEKTEEELVNEPEELVNEPEELVNEPSYFEGASAHESEEEHENEQE